MPDATPMKMTFGVQIRTPDSPKAEAKKVAAAAQYIPFNGGTPEATEMAKQIGNACNARISAALTSERNRKRL